MNDIKSTVKAGTADPAAIRRPRGSVDPDRIAEVGATWEREIGSDPRDPLPLTTQVQTASDDVLVPRDDLTGEHDPYDSTSYTFVAAGDRLPTRAEPVPADASPAYRAKVHKPKA